MVSSITASLRFNGTLNVDLTEFQTNHHLSKKGLLLIKSPPPASSQATHSLKDSLIKFRFSNPKLPVQSQRFIGTGMEESVSFVIILRRGTSSTNCFICKKGKRRKKEEISYQILYTSRLNVIKYYRVRVTVFSSQNDPRGHKYVL